MSTDLSPSPAAAPAAPRYRVRRATTAAELAAARAVVLRVAEADLGYGYIPGWHWDLDRMRETYVDNDRQAMFVAVAEPDPADGPAASGTVVATAAIRVGGPDSPPHPPGVAARYADRDRVAQLLRVATLPGHRRRGLARRLVEAATDFVRRDGRYRTICLHTNARVPGAEAFWRSLPTVEVHDARGDAAESDPRFATVHFELPLPIAEVPPGSDRWAADWVRRWDRQQEGYVERRDEGFALMFDVLERLGVRPGRLLDLGCGPGSLTARALRRFPEARVTVLDLDPVLLRLARGVLPASVEIVERDLRDPEWHHGLGDGTFDAVCTSTALHYLHPEHVEGVARGVARLLRPGGVFADHDSMLPGPGAGRLAAAAAALVERRRSAAFAADGREEFRAWWAALEAEPGLGELFAERRRRFAGPPPGGGTSVDQWTAALRVAGFAEVDTVAQDVERRLLVAVR
jgi:SAM-dependent methyltransferase/GNAT superfamily N-acetyltransferase